MSAVDRVREVLHRADGELGLVAERHSPSDDKKLQDVIVELRRALADLQRALADLQRIQDALEAARAVNVELAVRGDGGVSMTLEDDLRAALARLDQEEPLPNMDERWAREDRERAARLDQEDLT